MSDGAALYSVRMRAAVGGPHEAGGEHLSGAERLVEEEAVEDATLELLRRARQRGVPPDFVRITLERVPVDQVRTIPCLPVTTLTAPDPGAARSVAVRLLGQAGVAPAAIAAAFGALFNGPRAGGGRLRGAALLGALTGHRLEPDPSRGVRASHLDYTTEGRVAAQRALAEQGLTHFRTLEALAVASKVIWAGALAELCWSDDPDYLPGYVTTRAAGYVRFPWFKPQGAAGGRVLFVQSSFPEIQRCLDRLERQCVLVGPPVVVQPPVSAESFLYEMSSPGHTESGTGHGSPGLSAP